MKRILAFATALAVFTVATAALAQDKPLIAGFDGTFAPHAMPKMGGGVEGFNIDLILEAGKRMGLASFTWDRVRDQTIQALAKKVFVREDPALTAMLPQLRPARVTIHLRDGRELKGAADSNRGDDQDPYSREELCAKFSELTERAWSREAAQDLLEKLQRLDELRDVNLLLS